MSNIVRFQPEKLPDTATHDHRCQIQSESSSRKYIVSRKSSTGEFQCSCPAWIHHRHCKHLDAMKPALEAAIANELAEAKKQIKE
jgi:hypothetical protein